MKKPILFALAVLAGAVPALAGECVSGFSCNNECPLAQQANKLRAAGTESYAVAPSVRAVVAAEVARNLARV
jgi:hypothetical protein